MYGTVAAGLSWPVVYNLGYNRGVLDASLGRREGMARTADGEGRDDCMERRNNAGEDAAGKSLDDIFSDSPR